MKKLTRVKIKIFMIGMRILILRIWVRTGNISIEDEDEPGTENRSTDICIR